METLPATGATLQVISIHKLEKCPLGSELNIDAGRVAFFHTSFLAKTQWPLLSVTEFSEIFASHFQQPTRFSRHIH
jgi:hypothetical protein